MSETKRRIVVAEGDAAARTLLKRRLEAEGYAVEVAADGERALQLVAETRPELLIVDVALPGIDGIQIVRHLRGSPAAGLPIIVLSAFGREIVDRGLGGVRGPDACFSKPVDYRELQTKLQRLLARSVSPATVAAVVNGGLEHGGGVVAIVGATGGVGTTTIATNVGVALARRGLSTLLLETARFHGTLHQLWGLSGSGTTDDLPLHNPDLLVMETTERVVRTHPSGLRLLLGSSGATMPPSAEGIFRLTNTLRHLAPLVLVDLDAAVDLFGQVILRRADRVWIVVRPETASVERGRALLDLLDRWGVDARAVAVVVNQTSPEPGLDAAEVDHRLGRAHAGWIPYAGGVAAEAERRGLPLVETAREHPAVVAMSELAAAIGYRPTVAVR